MDDSKSDNTDDLLTSIDPLIFQSEVLLNEKDYKKNLWSNVTSNDDKLSRVGVIVDDIFSARSNDTNSSSNKVFELQKSPSMILSQTNIAAHNFVNNQDCTSTARTTSSHIYETSASTETTPRYNNSGLNGFRQSDSQDFNQPSAFYETSVRHFKRDLNLCKGDSGSTHNSNSESRTEIQRMQLTNKQLSTQLQEAKLSIQTLSIQLEQVQQECKHKESTLENLDNTLGRLVAGWKKRDSQKDEELDNLSHQLEAKDQVINESQKMIEESKVALNNAMKAMGLEKVKSEQWQKNVTHEIDSLKNERTELINDNKELAKRIVHLESELRKHKDLFVLKINSLETLKQQSMDEKCHLEKEIEHLKYDLGNAREEVSHQQIEIQIRDEKFDQLRNEARTMEDELYKSRKEVMDKDAIISDLKMKMKINSEEHSVSLKKFEKDFQMKFQHELNSALVTVNEQHKKSLQNQSNNFQLKLNDQAKRHRSELERLRQVAEQEIASRLSDSQETISMLRERLERSEKSVKFWQQEKESVEKARNQISSRLYELMKLGYRGNENVPESARNFGPILDQSRHIAVPKIISPSTYLSNLANNHNLPNMNMQNKYFEPIRLDSQSIVSSTAPIFAKSNSLSVVSEVRDNLHQNLSLNSTINTALSF